MNDGADTFRKVVEQLSRMSGAARPITEDTEVYGDLQSYGDDIVELVWWLEKEFGVRTNINPFVYAPRESLFPGEFAIRRLVGADRRYKSLKVRDVIAAIAAKRWPEERF